MSRALVFADLDGSLLDHVDYSFDEALPALRRLRDAAIPVIPVTSKTRAEVLPLREALGSEDPFIVENGAAVFIPRDYFPRQPGDTRELEGFWVREFGAARRDCIEALQSLEATFGGEFSSFADSNTADIMTMTGLDADSAALANRRDYSEPVQWLGTTQRRQAFIEQLAAKGFSAQQGGRFLTLSRGGDKGSALTWLRDVYREAWAESDIDDLAVGDGPNDIGMLEAATYALVVRAPGRPFPEVKRDTKTTVYSEAYGPAGWATGVTQWLQQISSPGTEGHRHG